MIQLVYAHNQKVIKGPMYGFGKDNRLPWGHCSKDLKEFKRVTEGTILVMGANTFKSLPSKLPGRPHAVIVDPEREIPQLKTGHKPDYVFGSLEQAINAIDLCGRDISIIGGPKLLEKGVKYADRIIKTTIIEHEDSDADVFIPELIDMKEFTLNSILRYYRHKEENIHSIEIVEYVRRV